MDRWHLSVDNALVRVTIIAISGQGAAARQATRSAGGRVLGGKYTDEEYEVIAAWVPISALNSLAQHPSIKSMDRPAEADRPEPRTVLGPQISRSTAPTGAATDVSTASVWDAAHQGQGVKVGVIDLGFADWRNHEATRFANKSCNDDEIFGPIDDNHSTDSHDIHGIIVSDALFELAPSATFYIAKSGPPDQLLDTVKCMQESGVEIINFSRSFPYFPQEGPGDGSGILNSVVDWAATHGVLWTQTPGNEARKHWHGSWQEAIRIGG